MKIPEKMAEIATILKQCRYVNQ